jgi:hypothetical protein
MSFLTKIGNALIANVGFRPILRGFANGEQDDDLATVGQVNALQPPVPFSFSALLQPDQGGAVNGISIILDAAIELPAEVFGGSGSGIVGFIFYIDTQRGSYWGDIEISVAASEIYDVEIALETIDNTQCNSLVIVNFNDDVVPEATYTVAITATGGGSSITRTFTLTIEPAA